MKWHKKILSWAKRNHKAIVGVVLHSLWLSASFIIEDMTQTQHIAGHGIIGTSTGVYIGVTSAKTKAKINNVIQRATNKVKGNKK